MKESRNFRGITGVDSGFDMVLLFEGENLFNRFEAFIIAKMRLAAQHDS
jgi:hypothetical protein